MRYNPNKQLSQVITLLQKTIGTYNDFGVSGAVRSVSSRYTHQSDPKGIESKTIILIFSNRRQLRTVKPPEL